MSLNKASGTSLLISSCVLTLLIIMAAPSYSAEQDNSPATETSTVTSPTEETSDTDNNTAETESKAPVDDSFVPSSQISEDLSVSFPVNI